MCTDIDTIGKSTVFTSGNTGMTRASGRTSIILGGAGTGLGAPTSSSSGRSEPPFQSFSELGIFVPSRAALDLGIDLFTPAAEPRQVRMAERRRDLGIGAGRRRSPFQHRLEALRALVVVGRRPPPPCRVRARHRNVI